ncbi:hypothetical protein EON65_22675 [archaeon]|nr:MAG: hypothetical protein EON65_22675 [archaeon]
MFPVEDEDDRMLPFTFDLPQSSLHFVNDVESLQRLRIAFADCVIVGIDTETRPMFVKRNRANQFVRPNPTSLVQMALRSSSGLESVHIVDMLTLKTQGLLNELDMVLVTVMCDDHCIKVGQSLINDFKELRMSYAHMQSFQKVHAILDTTVLSKVLQPELINTLSLKTLVKQYLHFQLVKGQQMSDWSRRPLGKAQIQYAACDALVLLRLYDAMVCEAEEKALKQTSEFNVRDHLEVFDHLAVSNSAKKKLKKIAAFAIPPMPVLSVGDDVTDKSECSEESSVPPSKKAKHTHF